MPWYYRVKAAINAAMPFLAPTQEANLALLVSAILKKANPPPLGTGSAYPTPAEKRRVPAPKHELLHRIKRPWRFTDTTSGWMLSGGAEMALVPYTIARPGSPRLSGAWPSTGGCSTPPCLRANGCASGSRGSPWRGRGGRCRLCNSPTIGTIRARTRARTG
jgi:hypothetical protein